MVIFGAEIQNINHMNMKIIALLLCFSCMTALSTVDASQNTPSSNVKEIIVIFKTHFDIGYTHSVEEVVNFYRTGAWFLKS